MTDAYIVGVDMIKFGRFPEKTVPQIGAQAALMALDDCGLTIQDMQALYCGNLGQAWLGNACCRKLAKPECQWSMWLTPVPLEPRLSAKRGPR